MSIQRRRGGEALAQADQSCGYPIPEGVQGLAGWGPGQPELLGGSPAHGRGLELDRIYGPL